MLVSLWQKWLCWGVSICLAVGGGIPLRCDIFSASGEFITRHVKVGTSVYPSPIFQVNSHLATGHLCNRTRKKSDVFQKWLTHFIWVFTISQSEKCAGKHLQRWHLLHCTLKDMEHSIQCQGSESLAMEMITHGHMVLSLLLALQYECQEHYQFGSGCKCGEEHAQRWGHKQKDHNNGKGQRKRNGK